MDVFGLDQIIVMDLDDGQTKARKLDSTEYQQWLADDYTPGELWNMNLLGGTSLIRLAIVVEGRTEEEFVKQVLSVHLSDHGVSTAPIIIGPPGHRGGRVTVDRIAAHVQRLVQNFDAITTLVDFYGFPGSPDG